MEHHGDYIEFGRDQTAGRFDFVANICIIVGAGVLLLPQFLSESPTAFTHDLTPYIAAGIGLFGILIKTTRTKVQFDIRNKLMRTHNYILGIRIGKWRKIEPLTDICLITKKYRNRNQRGMSDGSSVEVFELFLFNKDKSQKYFLLWSAEKSIIEEIKNDLQKHFQFEETTYTPKRVLRERRRI